MHVLVSLTHRHIGNSQLPCNHPLLHSMERATAAICSKRTAGHSPASQSSPCHLHHLHLVAQTLLCFKFSPSNLPSVFLEKKNSIPLGKNPVKTSCFFLSKQLRSGNLPYSYERFKCRNTQVPPTGPYPLPDPTLPHPGPVLGGARPGREGWTPMQAQSSRPAPAQPCPAPATEVFPQYSIFFRDIQSFLLAILTGFLPRHVLHLQLNFPSVLFFFLEHTGCFPCVRSQ